MKNLSSILILFACLSLSLKAQTISIKEKSYAYDIIVPADCGVIPMDTLKAKFGKEHFDAGLFYKNNNKYFDGEYILYRFMLTRESLLQFEFSQIAKEIKRNIDLGNNAVLKNKAGLQTTNFNIDDKKFYFYMDGKVLNKSGERLYKQVIIPTKFGYIIAIAYQPLNGKPNNKLSTAMLYGSVQVEKDFIYHEPESKININYWHIAIAFAIGLIVYLIIEYSPIAKRSSKTK